MTAGIVRLWEFPIEMASSMLHGPAFLPHQTQVSMKTPCGSGCGSGDRLWMPPIRFRESANNSSQ